MNPIASSNRPLVVVTVNDPSGAADRALTERKNELYLDCIRTAGGEAAALHTSTPADLRARLLAEMAGLLLSGGPDLDPALYGEEPDGAVDIGRARDALELDAWREAERRSLPVLGICRGLQAMNVFSGGCLVQHVPDHAGAPYGHGLALTHEIAIEPGTDLARMLGVSDDPRPRLLVNTFHHQAVVEAGLAAGLRPAAWAESGSGRLVEGLEGNGARWLVGVQCHPERRDSSPPEFEGLWCAFVEEARTRGKGSESA